MALTTPNSIEVKNLGGAYYSAIPDVDGTYSKGDIVRWSKTNAGQVEKGGTVGEAFLGIVAADFDSTALLSRASNADNQNTGANKMRVIVGRWITYCKVTGSPGQGVGLKQSNTEAVLEAAAAGDTMGAIVVDDTAVDTDYLKVMLL